MDINKLKLYWRNLSEDTKEMAFLILMRGNGSDRIFIERQVEDYHKMYSHEALKDYYGDEDE